MGGKEPIYARNFQEFLKSSDAAPVSSDPDRAGWADPAFREGMIQQFLSTGGPPDQAPDFAELLIYNKSRDAHRVCPHCRRAYLPEAHEGTTPRVLREQKLSGICSWGCYNALNGGQMKELFGGGPQAGDS